MSTERGKEVRVSDKSVAVYRYGEYRGNVSYSYDESHSSVQAAFRDLVTKLFLAEEIDSTTPVELAQNVDIPEVVLATIKAIVDDV